VGFVFDPLSSKVISAAVQVHKALGPGFLEGVYEEALKIELASRDIRFEAQKQTEVVYAGKVVGNHVLDLLVEDQLVIELKAVSDLKDVHFAQVRSYLKATGCKVGLLMNFGRAKIAVKRVVLGYQDSDGDAAR